MPHALLCHAASVVGTPKLDPVPGLHTDAAAGTVVTESSEVPEEAWIDLAGTDKLTTKHPHTTREVTFVGPGRVRTCVSRGEEAWVEQGIFESVASSAERPGGEQWVMTPAGVVRYGASKLEVHVTSGAGGSGARTDINVTTGTAFAWTGDQSSGVKGAAAPKSPSSPNNEGWTRVEQGQTLTFTQGKGQKPLEAAKVALDRCTFDAKAAHELASAVAMPDASLSELAPRHVAARHVARAACGVAALRVTTLEGTAEREGLLARVKEADIEWRGARPGRSLRGRPH